MRQEPLRYKLSIFLTLVIGILMFQSVLFPSGLLIKENFMQEERGSIKTSDFWVLPYIIHINNNWSATESTYDWCTGSGSLAVPYVIENVTIDAQNSGSCIYIEHTNDYFIIQNCTLLNCQASPNAAIRLDYVTNGKILDNNITNNNGRAISLYSTSFTLVEGNDIVNNGYGITLSYGSNNKVLDNYIQDSDMYGIYLWDSDNNVISENEVNHNGYYAGGYHGIYISESGSPSYVDSINNTVRNNNIYNNRKSGIYINSCDNNTIFGNSLKNNVEYGIYLYDSDDINIIGNEIYGSQCISSQSSLNTKEEWNVCNYVIDPFIIDELGTGNFTWDELSQFAWCSGDGSYGNPYSISSLVIDAQSSGSCIWVKNSYNNYFTIDGCLIMNAEASGSAAGIKFDWVNNGTLHHNSILENYVGMYLSHCVNTTIYNNELEDNTGQGIVFYQSTQNQIFDNIQFGSNYYGLFLNAGSDNNTVIGNTFEDNTGAATHGDGIRILNSDDNHIIDNDLLYNDRGIKIDSNSHNNTITLNSIVNNTNYGVLVITGAQDNTFYLNTFENFGYDGYDNGTDSLWDNGTIGNSWSDYAGVDANDNGIGDTPYLIDGMAGSVDNYPIFDDGPEDNTPPAISINSPTSGAAFNSPPAYDILITEDNLDTAWYTIDDGANNITIISNSGTIDVSAWSGLSDGAITIDFYANDTAGNLGTAEVTVTKDATPPVIVINNPTDGQVFGTTPPDYNISITEDNLDSMWYTIDGGVTNFTLSAYVGILATTAWDALADGAITVTFYAEDTAGNLASVSITIEKDTTQPTPAIPFGSFYIIFAVISVAVLLTSIKNKLKKIV